ncbi:MAG: EamA family transporter [Rhodothermaceae bacterium]|nr:EamA family transporter [Rhodothermaceae bacterium]
MLWLALAVACSLAIAMIFKYGERRGLDRTAVLTVNYAAAALVSAMLLRGSDVDGGFVSSAGLLVLGVGLGVLFIAGFYVFAYAIREVGMGLATGVMRLSVVVPVLASWVLWGEQPSIGQSLGLVLAGVAFFLIARTTPTTPTALTGPTSSPSSHSGLYAALVLGGLFLMGGLVDVAFKTFGEVFAADNSRPLFLLFVFSVACLTGLIAVVGQGLRSKAWPSGSAVGWGVLLGLVNYGSADFILRAIAVLPGPFVFPANSIAIVMGAAVLGIVVWGERLSKANWAGLGLAAAALVLLTR